MRTIYKARDGWRWRLQTKNGRIVADSGEAYTREADAKRAFIRVARLFAGYAVR